MRELLADGLALVGLAFVAVGLWWIDPAIALVVVGALMVVVAMGLAGARGRRIVGPPGRAPRDR